MMKDWKSLRLNNHYLLGICKRVKIFRKERKRGTEKGEENIYRFYKMIPFFKIIKVGGRELSSMWSYYVRRPVRMLRPGGDIYLIYVYILYMYNSCNHYIFIFDIFHSFFAFIHRCICIFDVSSKYT